MIGTNLAQYKKRGQSNPEKIKRQIVTGKLGELAVAKAFNTNAPDFVVYEKKKKSFGADLKYKDLELHIKTQDKESAAKYGASWLFQWSGGGGFGHTDKLLTKPEKNDVAIFVTIDAEKLECEIIACVRCMLLPQMLSMPKLIQLFGSKRVVYAESIEAHHKFDLKGYVETEEGKEEAKGERIA